MNDLIDTIYRDYEVEDAAGNRYPLNSHIDRSEGRFLVDFIRSRSDVVRTLEVGCAYGLSSLHITEALRGRAGAEHIIVDAFQTEMWKGIGVHYLKQAGIDFFELIEELSELALPSLLLTRPESFDMIFIDGWHTFDHTLLDLFYANRLVRVGGYIIVDDCTLPSVAKAVDYIANYPCYRIVGGPPLPGKPRLRGRLARAVPKRVAARIVPRNFYDRHFARTLFPTMVALQKVAPDQREWTWFEPF